MRNRYLVPHMETFSIRYESIHGRQEESGIPLDIKRIDLSMRGIKRIDLSSLHGCRSLETIDLSKNNLEDIDLLPLAKIKSIKHLKIHRNRLSTISLWPLFDSPHLEDIDLSQNKLERINLTPIIQHVCVLLDEHTIVEIDYSLRYLLGGKDSTRINLCNSSGVTLGKSPRMIWKKYDEIMLSMDWDKLKKTLVHTIEKMDRRQWFRFQKGVLEGFGIDELAGFDGNPKDLFEELPTEGDFQLIRNAIYDRAIYCLEKQLMEKGSTLFLDVQRMTGTRASKLIPLVVVLREEEIQNVSVHIGGRRANLLPLWLTYYGFEILAVLKFGLTTDMVGLDLISRNLEQLGHSLKTEHVDFEGTKTSATISEGLIDYIYSIASMN